MTLYEIDAAIRGLIDTDTGEITDFEALDSLQMAREQKIENIALAYKNAMADAAAYKAEEDSFAQRRKKAARKAEDLKAYLEYALAGQPFQTTMVDIRYRASKRLVIAEGTVLPEEYTTVTIEPNKTAIKEAIASGISVDGCTLQENSNIQIK